jgi:DNA modification methylase
VTSPPYWGLRDYGVAGQIGLEHTPGEYVARMVEVFREVRRILKTDGTLWLNLGDSYNAAGRVGHGTRQGYKQGTNRASANGSDHTRPSDESLKPKDLVGVPWRVAFALQADGWYLRSDIIWSKPNPMPESVTDRPTKAHEYVFLMAKSEHYYYDSGAIKEPSVTCDPRRPYTSQGAWDLDGRPDDQKHGGEPRSWNGSSFTGKRDVHLHPNVGKKPRTAGNKNHKYVTEYESSETEEHRTKAGLLKVADVPWESRNRRTVWTIATQPYSEAHFAVYPPSLVEPCILAGSPEGGLILDPFAGSGTTGMVAKRYGCRAVLIELNAAYCAIAARRLAQGVMELTA